MNIELTQIDDFRWEVPRTGAMRVPGLIFSSRRLLNELRKDESVVQVSNVAQLPGIVRYALAMPDMHWGYGFPIGGVAEVVHGAGLSKKVARLRPVGVIKG